jgi:spore maturation protein CgeB
MKVLCVFGQHNYGDPARGEGYEYSNFLPALRALGHEVHHFESWNRNGHADFAELNSALLRTVDTQRPDLLFCVLMSYEVWVETLRAIRQRGVPVLNWGTDDSWRYEQFSRYVGPHVDLWATTSHAAAEKAARERRGSFVLTQWAASNARTCEPLPAEQCRYDVSFVGSSYGNRPQWVQRLAAHGIEVECFGQGWPRGPVAAEEIPRIYRESRVSLNFGDSGLQWRGLIPYRSRQIKARTFEVPAAGGCLLTQPADRIDTYYRIGEEIVLFDDEQQLVDSLRSLLRDPRRRDAIAWAGYRRTASEHLYEIRFQALLQECLRRHRRPNDVQETFEAVMRRHTSASWAGKLSLPMIALFRMVWGERRGPRAARRMMYELYWRLFGLRTYTAAGLPGRLFYRDT